jgi:HlyD family secretion protein
MAVRRSLFILLLLIIILPTWAFQNSNQPTSGEASIRLSDLQLYEVRRGNVALTVNAIGAIAPDNDVQLSFLTAGEVADVFVQRDEYVLAGDTLMRLENELQRISYEQALIALERAELQLQDLLEVDEETIRLAELGVENARAAYRSVVNAVLPSDIEAAEVAYSQALEFADSLRQQRDAVGGQVGSENIQWQQANAAYGEATFQAEIARLQVERLRNSTFPQANVALAGIAEAEAQLQQVRAGPTEAEREATQSQIEQAQVQLDRAEVAYNRTILEAPFDGVITAVNAEIGSLAAPGLTVIELMDVSPLGLTVQVDEIDIDLVEIGLPTRVTLDALPNLQFPATVISIAPIGTPSGGIVSYDVDIALDGDDPRVRVGMTADASIVIEETQDVLVVPNLYIRRDRTTGQSFVNVLRGDDTVEEVEVEIGIQGRETSEVISGIEEGALVAIDLSGRGLNILGGGQ